MDQARFGEHKCPFGGRVLVAGGEDLQNVGKLSGVRRHKLKQSCEQNKTIRKQLQQPMAVQLIEIQFKQHVHVKSSFSV